MCILCVAELTGAAAIIVKCLPFMRARVTSWVKRRRS
jgi:hypothetical protein